MSSPAPSRPSRLHPHRHDLRADGGGGGALGAVGAVRRAGGSRPGRPLPAGVALRHRTGAGGGRRSAAGRVGGGDSCEGEEPLVSSSFFFFTSQKMIKN